MSEFTGFSLHELRIQDYLAPEGLSIGDLYVQGPVVVALWALAVSCGVGVLSGVFPAWRASNLDPIQALRYE